MAGAAGRQAGRQERSGKEQAKDQTRLGQTEEMEMEGGTDRLEGSGTALALALALALAGSCWQLLALAGFNFGQWLTMAHNCSSEKWATNNKPQPQNVTPIYTLLDLT